jgi:Na+-transporting NADH:ubiquinone oxidoreductase subunit NqrE
MFVATLILVFSCFVSTVLVNAAEKENYLITDKIYADVDINDDFDETSVIVVLDSIVSEINKDHSSTIFKDINYLEIIDLTFVNDITTIIDIENFEQILKIKLSNPGKENVINMINELSLINGIKYAGPNRYLKV